MAVNASESKYMGFFKVQYNIENIQGRCEFFRLYDCHWMYITEIIGVF